MEFTVYPGAPHDIILTLLLQAGLLLFTARALGELAQRWKQPSVVGEILAGVLLGPSCLSTLFPAFGAVFLPRNAEAAHLLDVFSLIGSMMLLLAAGWETDLGLIRRHLRTALGVSSCGILVTFLSGYLLGDGLPDSLLGNPDERIVFNLFVATSMSISAIPVIAKVLMDMKLMRRDIGQIIIASGMIDDSTGWILLSIVAGMAHGQEVTAATGLVAAGKVLFFLAFSLTVGRKFVIRIFAFVQDKTSGRDRLLSFILVLMFFWAAFTQALQLEPVLGAFMMGIILNTIPRIRADVHRKLESFAMAVFAPIFFAIAGLKVNLLNLASPHLIFWTVCVIGVATAGKVVGTYIGARWIGRRSHWYSLAFGAGLNARGAMEIIVATIGLSLGILNPDMFSIIVIMAIATSLMAPPSLRWVLKHVQMDPQEAERLRTEALQEGSRIAHIRRALLPVRPAGESQNRPLAVQLMKRFGSPSLTLMCVTDEAGRAAATADLNALKEQFTSPEVLTRVVASDNVAAAVLNEARKDYDLVVLGTPAKGHSWPDLNFIAKIVSQAPCSSLLLRVDENQPVGQSHRRFLVPTNGTEYARAAAELAFRLAEPEDEVVILHVVEEGDHWLPSEASRERRLGIANSMVAGLRELGESQKVVTVGEVTTAIDVTAEILRIAESIRTDFLVLGASLRTGSDRIYFGPSIERLFREAPGTVILLNSQ